MKANLCCPLDGSWKMLPPTNICTENMYNSMSVNTLTTIKPSTKVMPKKITQMWKTQLSCKEWIFLRILTFLTSFVTHTKRPWKLKTSITYMLQSSISFLLCQLSWHYSWGDKRRKREALQQILTAGTYGLQSAHYFTSIVKPCPGALVKCRHSESFYQRPTPVWHDTKIKERNK